MLSLHWQTCCLGYRRFVYFNTSMSHNTHVLNQVAKDHQLLDTARDYFQFVTAFSEPINTSATHIYHSALELSPLSSIVRKFYYYQRPHPSPRVVLGNPDSWKPQSSTSAINSHYLSPTWSPSGQSIAVATEGGVRLLGALSLKPLSTLQSARVTIRLRRGLAFSPDGCSLVGCSDSGMIIWDTQTGGVVKEIECEVPASGLELIWALDGKTIGTIHSGAVTYTMHIYNIVVGNVLSSIIFQSWCKPYIWAYSKSFQIATTAREYDKGWTINTFKAGSTLVEIGSFPFESHLSLEEFSPSTHRILVSAQRTRGHNPELLALDHHNPGAVLFKETGSYAAPFFSPDASFFGASISGHFSIWRYTSGNYIHWRVLRTPGGE